MILGALSGIAWWMFSIGLEAIGTAQVGDILGHYEVFSIIAGIFTGIAMTKISMPIYRRSVHHLLWYSPLSVYLAIAIYGFILFIFRSAAGEYLARHGFYQRCFGQIFAMWLGVTIIWPMLVITQAGAYLNHRLLRVFLCARRMWPHWG